MSHCTPDIEPVRPLTELMLPVHGCDATRRNLELRDVTQRLYDAESQVAQTKLELRALEETTQGEKAATTIGRALAHTTHLRRCNCVV
jgi:hypothetical protein